MTLPLVGAGLLAVARFIASKGAQQAVKKYGSKAVKAVKDAERGVASKIGSKESFKPNPYSGNNSFKPTKSQLAKNVRSGRQRMYGGLSSAATIPSLMSSEGDKGDEDEAGRTKTTTPTGTSKTTTPTGTSKTTTPKTTTPKATPKATAPNWEDYNSIAEAKKAGSLYYSKGKGADKERMAAVLKEDLAEEDLATKNPLRNYMNRQIKKDKARDAVLNMPTAPMKAGGKVRGMKAGGKVRGMKAGGKVRGMKSGGKVRGAGIARKGTRACKMR
jgi:hypothetical protein